MGKSSLSVSFFPVIKALDNISSNIISWPSVEERMEIQQGFRSAAGLNKVIGAVDGTFVPIKAPKEDSEVYITRKCNYAVTLQAVCDHNLKFTDVFVGYPGSVSDTRIFRNSDLYKMVENNQRSFFSENEVIIGDKAYPLLNWCLPPYIDRGTLTRAQKNFNEVHSKTRQTIERPFALLFGRFRRLRYLDMVRHDSIPLTILSTCVLHNICLNYEDLHREEYIQDGREMINNENVDNNEIDIQAINLRRDAVCRALYINNDNN